MGTDDAPATEVAGAIRAVREFDDVEIVLVGDEHEITAALNAHDGEWPSERLHIHHAPDRVLPGDKAAKVLRTRPESSMVVGVKLHAEGEVDAFISAGSTGAVMATSLFLLRPLPGVDRPTVATVLPTAGRPTVLVDSGTNVDCKPSHLHQFAHLGAVYARDILGAENPRVGLLNIGEEPGKGDETAVETHALLAADASLNFVGNIEGRVIIEGRCDVLVADGFVGNVLLKFYESVALFVAGLVQKELEVTKTPLDLRHALRRLDYSEYGGAPLLGVNGVSIICHGGSSPKAITNAVRVAAQAARGGMIADMRSEFADRVASEGAEG